MDFGSVLGINLEPCWPPRGAQEATKTPQEAPRRPPRGPQDALWTFKTPPRGPKRPLEASKIDFWWIFDRFWVEFSLFFDRIFSCILDGFWVDFSCILDRFFRKLDRYLLNSCWNSGCFRAKTLYEFQ